MADPEVSTTLSTGQSILIDGANGVTSAPRAHFPLGGVWLGLALVVAVLVRVVKRPLVLHALLIAGALPGFVHLLVLRADAPWSRSALAEEIEETLEDLEQYAPWPHRAVAVVREDESKFPLGRYAVPGRKPGGGGVQLELRDGAGVCRQAQGRVVCGGPR